MGTTTREIDWRALVESVDGQDRHQDSLYPVVYIFSNAAKKKDTGPASGIYAGDT